MKDTKVYYTMALKPEIQLIYNSKAGYTSYKCNS